MVKAKHIKNTIATLEYLLFIMNVIIAFRLIIISIDLNRFIDYKTGKMSFVGQNIKFFQTIMSDLTDPFINPFKNILMNIMGQENSDLVNIFAPMFSIVVVLFAITILKVVTPVIIKYLRKHENSN